jgi:hypothetical protein
MVAWSNLPAEVKDRLLDERRRASRAAATFARICRDGSNQQLYDAHLLLNECEGWRLAMAKVAKLPRVSPEIQDAFVYIWVESKMLPLRVGHRPTMAAALRVLMPRGYSGPPLILYRGTTIGERRRRVYGFSWTTEIATARSFAENWTRSAQNLKDMGAEHWTRFALKKDDWGIVLKTLAPPEAVLLIRKPEDYHDEGEVVVDPYRLGKIDVVGRI